MIPNETFLPYGRQTITEDDIDAVVSVLRSQFLTQGPVVPSFEKSIASRVGQNMVLQLIVLLVPCILLAWR